ncbi:hypothetical protein [Caldimonas brevitalea]|uniref:hypothetical protein n=1 Tax=Caldimonas brevitalea TaxID=413882 RepID=UPI0012FBEC89|nr:hypothetical protein [Caldimonas brevitalea]
MTKISSDQAAALAEAFLRAKRGKSPIGPLSSIKHSPAPSLGQAAGEYCVEFAYAGPPVKRKTTPPRDHPTVVFVSDETGECRLMFWM